MLAHYCIEIMNHGGKDMRRKSIRAFSMMLLMITAGCLQAVDGVIEDIDRTIDALEGTIPS